ncbi:discoidin domain-containing protein, partial [bacterium]|nr:discoidin domain-containing protein [bacterium]
NNTYPAWVMLDLGESKTVSAAVMYGLLTNYANANQKQFDNFEIYVAEDTTNWGSPVSINEKESGYIRFDFDPVTGRYVKFKANEGANIRIAWIREFAAFGQ